MIRRPLGERHLRLQRERAEAHACDVDGDVELDRLLREARAEHDVGAAALAVYATFLGTDGEAYRFLRRYGVIVFFGCSYLAQLLFLRAARSAKRIDRRLAAMMLAVCVAMLALGVGNTIMKASVSDADLADRIENTLEWHLGVLLVAWFVLQAVVWRRSGYGFDFTMSPPRNL